MKASWQAPGMNLFYRSILFLAWCYFKVFYRLKVYGLENFTPKAAIIAPNHTSFLDPPLVAVSCPQEVQFLARESLFRVFGLGALIRALNTHPVSGDASDVAVFRTLCKLLNEGKKVILFPEGARQETDALGVIKPGISLLVSRTNSAIIPTYVHGTYKAWNRHHRFPKPWGKTACVFGSPILWETFANMDKREAQTAMTEALKNKIEALRLWYLAGAEGTPP